MGLFDSFKGNKEWIELPISGLFDNDIGTEDVEVWWLEIEAKVEVNGENYYLMADYEENDPVCEEIREKMEELNIKTLKTYIDLDKMREMKNKKGISFKFDIEDLFKRLGLEVKVKNSYVLGFGCNQISISDPNYEDETIKKRL